MSLRNQGEYRCLQRYLKSLDDPTNDLSAMLHRVAEENDICPGLCIPYGQACLLLGHVWNHVCICWCVCRAGCNVTCYPWTGWDRQRNLEWWIWLWRFLQAVFMEFFLWNLQYKRWLRIHGAWRVLVRTCFWTAQARQKEWCRQGSAQDPMNLLF